METVANISLPFFALIAAGWVAGRSGVLDQAAAAGIGVFVYWFALPALLFTKMSATPLFESFDWRFIAAYSGGGLLSFLVCVLLGRLLFQPSLAQSGIQGMAASFGNVGYLGLPLILAVFGDAVLLPAVMVIALDHLLLLPLTNAMIAVGSGKRADPAEILGRVLYALSRNPLIIATLAGVVWGEMQWGLPAPAASFGDLLAASAGPAALFSLGATLAGRSLSSGAPEVALMTFCKLVVHPVLAFGIGKTLALDPLFLRVAVLEASLPVAANVYIMARANGIYVERTSAVILMSTACAVFTVSAVLLIVA